MIQHGPFSGPRGRGSRVFAATVALASAMFCVSACSSDDTGGATPAPSDAGDCWYCAGDASQSEGGGDASGGKSGLLVFDGEINRAAGTGTWRYASYSASKTPDCTVTYAVQNLTAEASCTACTFAHRFTLGAGTTQGQGCAAGAGLSGTSIAYGQGPGGKGTVLFGEKSGAWSEIGASDLKGDVWTFTDLSAAGGNKPEADGGKPKDAGGGDGAADAAGD